MLKIANLWISHTESSNSTVYFVQLSITRVRTIWSFSTAYEHTRGLIFIFVLIIKIPSSKYDLRKYEIRDCCHILDKAHLNLFFWNLWDREHKICCQYNLESLELLYKFFIYTNKPECLMDNHRKCLALTKTLSSKLSNFVKDYGHFTNHIFIYIFIFVCCKLGVCSLTPYKYF